MSENKERNVFGGVHLSTDMHGNLLKILDSLNSDVHEATNPVIEGSSI